MQELLNKQRIGMSNVAPTSWTDLAITVPGTGLVLSRTAKCQQKVNWRLASIPGHCRLVVRTEQGGHETKQ